MLLIAQQITMVVVLSLPMNGSNFVARKKSLDVVTL